MLDIVVQGTVTRRIASGGNAGSGGSSGGLQLEVEPVVDVRGQLNELLLDLARGGPGPRATPLDVSVQLLLRLPSGEIFGDSAFATVDAANRFSAILTVDERRLDDGFTFVVRVEGVAPPGFGDAAGLGGQLTIADIPPGAPDGTPGAQLLAVLQNRLREIQVPIAVDALARFPVTVGPAPDGAARTFRGITNAVIEFLAGDGTQHGVGVLRGDEDTRTADVLIHPAARNGPLWFRIRRGTNVRTKEPSNTSTLARSVLTDPLTPGFSSQIAMSRVVETIGAGGLANEISEDGVVEGLPLVVYRDLDIDFTTNSELRVRCKVGQGFELDGVIVMLAQLGEFEGTYEFGLSEVSGAPFAIDGLGTAVTVTGRSASFDAIPFSDADELSPAVVGIPLSVIELGVATFIFDEILGQLRTRIGQRIRDRAEAAFQEIRERLDRFPETADEVVASAFVHISSLEMNADEMTLVIRSGAWHPVLDTLSAEVECAVTQAAILSRRRAVVPAGRMVQARLRTRELQPWAEAYERHKTSLARMLKADPELAEAVARAIVEAAPVALGLTPILSPDLRRRALKVAKAIESGASGELAEATAVAITLIESHDAHRPLLQRAEQLAALLPHPPSRTSAEPTTRPDA